MDDVLGPPENRDAANILLAARGSTGDSAGDGDPSPPGALLGQAPRSGWRIYVLAIVLILMAWIAGEVWHQLLSHHRNLGMPFIIALTIIGALGGLRPALFGAALSIVIYRYFLTFPFYNFNIETSDLLPVATFLATAIVCGALAGQLSDRARSAADRLRRLTILFDASREFSAAANQIEVARRLTERLRADAGLESAVYALQGQRRTLLARTEGMSELQNGAAEGQGFDCQRATLIPLRTARGEIATLRLKESPGEINDADRDWLDALLHLGAISLDRAALATEISEARLIAEREGLRTALLSSLSHDLRTPIATIMASATSLSDLDSRLSSETRRELLEEIQDQAERLNRYVANLLDMTRLETGVLVLKKSLVDPAEAVSSAIDHCRRLQGYSLVRKFEPLRSAVLVDPILLEQALVNILDNAAKFSSLGSRIEVSVRSEAGEVKIAVTDDGPGIPADEAARIFDKFFRGNPDRGRHAGVGLGLTVVRGLVESFGGRVMVESPVSDRRGARFVIILPEHAILETEA